MDASLLRISLFFLVWAIAWLPFAVPLAIALRWRPGTPISLSQKLPLVASLYLVAPFLLWGIATLQETTLATYGLPWSWSLLMSLGWGWFGGVGGLLLLIGLEWGLGWLTPVTSPANENDRFTDPSVASSQSTQAVEVIESVNPIASAPSPVRPMAILSTLAFTSLLGVWIGFTEELVFRGYLLHELQVDHNPWVAAAIASFIFALLHLVWEGQENLPQLPGLWLMGMVLTLARWADGGNLGLAWGLHAGWVGAIAFLDTVAWFKPTKTVPGWITGIDNKLLAGLVGIGFLLGTGIVLWGIAFRLTPIS